MRFIAILVLLLSLPGLAHASNGVLEINHACAVNTGCFSGDTAGYPVTIDASAGNSYQLTSNLGQSILIGGTLNVSAIVITADNVTLDLGGFRISCSVILGMTCGGSGAASGVKTSNVGTSVTNGSVVGMPNNGIELGQRSQVTNVRVRLNGDAGIVVASGSTVTGNLANENLGHGIDTGSGSTVTGNTSISNGGDGVNGSSGSTVSGNTVSFNGDDGIETSFGSTISDNTGYGNDDHGFTVFASSVVRANTATNNLGSGIHITGNGNRIELNSVVGNLRGYQIIAAGNILLKNTADGNLSGNYVISAGNSYGPLVGVPGVGDITGTVGADHPWANFGF